MYRHRLIAPVAAVAFAVACVPGAAHAASSAQAEAATTSRLASSLSTGKSVSGGFNTFSSPVSKSVRKLQTPSRASSAAVPATGTTIYVGNPLSCYDGVADPGTGTAANPYCLIQDAVNAAAPGDTISVADGGSYWYLGSVEITTSDISIVGLGTQAWARGATGVPSFELDGVSNVTITNLIITPVDAAAFVVNNSAGVTLDSSSIEPAVTTGNSPIDQVTIDGTSSGITVSRTDIATAIAPHGRGITVAAGAKNITLASDVLADSGITATGVTGLDVVGDTIQRGCASAVDIEGTSTGVYVENNLLEDAVPGVDTGGTKADCATGGAAWSPNVTVASTSSAGTTADYNDFYIYSTDATAPYEWAGTTYPTLSAFQSGTTQGSHDTIESVQPLILSFRPNEGQDVDALLLLGSAAIGSANMAAPGKLSTDFLGRSPYNCRGALQLITPDPQLAVALNGQATSALGISLTANVTSAPISLSLTFAWGDGTTTTSRLGNGGAVTLPHTYPKAGQYQVTVTVTDNQGDTVSNTVTATTAGSDYTAYGPVRLLDTRNGTGTGGRIAKVGANSALKLQITGAGTSGHKIPSNITAVVLNLTVTRPTSGGYLTAYPNEDPAGTPQPRPLSSNVNFNAGQTVPNLAIVPVGADGVVDLYNGSAGTTDVVADATGYFTQTTSSGYGSLWPTRLVDTRKGLGAPKAQVPANGSIPVQIAGMDGELPASGITAVSLNVTVVNERSNGYLTVYPDGGTMPTASNLNFSPGQVIANAVIVPVGADGRIRVFNGSAGGADVVVDVVGYYSPENTSAYLPVVPTRVLDTRSAAWGKGPLPANSYVYLYSQQSVTDPGIIGFVFNTTVTHTQANGYETVSFDSNTLAAYQDGTALVPPVPNASNVNWVAGQTVPNLVQVGTGSSGIVDFWNRSGGNADLVVDQFGYYQTD